MTTFPDVTSDNYRPSQWSRRVRVCIFAGIAMFIAIYMGLYEWRLISTVWDPVFDQGTMNVLDSNLSHQLLSWLRMPDAILGAFAYLADIVFGLAGSERRWQDRPWLVFLFGLNVIPLGMVSAILVAMQGLVVHSYCFLCLITAAISLLLIFLAYEEIAASATFLYRVFKKSKSWKVVLYTFFGRASKLAFEISETIAKIGRK